MHVGDVGTDFNITILTKSGETVDISTVSDPIVFSFKRPDGTTFNRLGSVLGDGSAGIVTYRTVDGDIDQYGRWQLQVFVSFCSTELYTRVLKFTVLCNL